MLAEEGVEGGAVDVYFAILRVDKIKCTRILEGKNGLTRQLTSVTVCAKLLKRFLHLS